MIDLLAFVVLLGAICMLSFKKGKIDVSAWDVITFEIGRFVWLQLHLNYLNLMKY